MENSICTILGASGLALLLAACGGSSRDVHPVESPNLDEDPNGDSPELTGDWQLIWSDEFGGDEIDTSKWSHEQNCWGGGNNELQCYTSRSDNSFVDDGYLYIVARKEAFSGPGVPDDDPSYNADDQSVTRQYTSARLRTKNKGDWHYGRMEISAKMPEGQGLWPAIWMLPTDNVYGGWPLSGEIDIFEAVNTNASGENEVHGTLHYGYPWPNNLYSGAAYSPEAPIWEEFHTYAIEWEEGEIRWYVEDVHYATQTDDGWFTLDWHGQNEGFSLDDNAAPFDQLFHMILNVAVGGDWPGSPDTTTTFPQQMVVDYVRVYECDAGLKTGKGCATVSEDAEHVDGNAGDQQLFDLYVDGPATLNFKAFGSEVNNTLKPASGKRQPGSDGIQ